jgi:hypothetical protein
MKRFIIAAAIGLTFAPTLSTSASAFECLARSTNGVSAWGSGLFGSMAKRFAIRHCRTAKGIGCYIAFCR